ncbi:MAG TPA: helix-turn-helix domain-containing protein [Solirubrobacterales bacterium]|nr:helix-turn-helix domain-containing protein [Solirubrobacterales bacterium]
MATGNGSPSQGNGNGHATGLEHVNGDGGGHGAVPVDWERLARATAHPLRVSILEILGLDGGRVLSPNDLSQELQIPLSNTNYHVTELAKGGLIELCGQRQVRGATERFYRLPGTEAVAEDADPRLPVAATH